MNRKPYIVIFYYQFQMLFLVILDVSNEYGQIWLYYSQLAFNFDDIIRDSLEILCYIFD